jgi:DNA invertase Pin-like site-specific DNA recombinase
VRARPQLQTAISHAKTTEAKLVIARLDRLVRNLHFVSSLQERGVDFVAADMPDANRLAIHIIAAAAEAVGRTFSENTKTALAAAKARGEDLRQTRRTRPRRTSVGITGPERSSACYGRVPRFFDSARTAL